MEFISLSKFRNLEVVGVGLIGGHLGDSDTGSYFILLLYFVWLPFPRLFPNPGANRKEERRMKRESCIGVGS
jgi:hypothetical protein